MTVPYRAVLDYLGYRGRAADERVLALIESTMSELNTLGPAKTVFSLWDCYVDESTISCAGLTIRSERLARHLKGCKQVSLFAATIGVGADTLIRRYLVSNIEKAVVADAVASLMVDMYCDSLEEEIACLPSVSCMRKTVRFSPGYGDFELYYQKDILRLLDAGKKIGLTLTEGHMLVPSKSVTAITGFC